MIIGMFIMLPFTIMALFGICYFFKTRGFNFYSLIAFSILFLFIIILFYIAMDVVKLAEDISLNIRYVKEAIKPTINYSTLIFKLILSQIAFFIFYIFDKTFCSYTKAASNEMKTNVQLTENTDEDKKMKSV